MAWFLGLAWTVIWAALILGAAYLAGGLLASAARAALDRTGLDPSVKRLVASLVRPVVVVVGVVAALSSLGVDLTSVVAVLGAATLAVGLALRESLSNIAAGALILTLRPVGTGDAVEIGGEVGTVVDIHLFHTTLRTAAGTLVFLPNNVVVRGPIRNHTRDGARRVDVTLTVAHDTDLAALCTAVGAAASGAAELLAEPAPVCLVIGVDDLGVQVLANAWCAPAAFARVRADLVARCTAAALEAGAVLPTRGLPRGPG